MRPSHRGRSHCGTMRINSGTGCVTSWLTGGDASPSAVVSRRMLLHMIARKMRSHRSLITRSAIRSWESGKLWSSWHRPSSDPVARSNPVPGRRGFLYPRFRGPVLATAEALIDLMRLGGPRIQDGSFPLRGLTALRASNLKGVSWFHGGLPRSLLKESVQCQSWFNDKLRLSGFRLTLPWLEPQLRPLTIAR